MSGKPVSLYWRICWSVLTPVLMIIIFIYGVISTRPLTYSKLNYPGEYIGEIIFDLNNNINADPCLGEVENLNSCKVIHASFKA